MKLDRLGQYVEHHHHHLLYIKIKHKCLAVTVQQLCSYVKVGKLTQSIVIIIIHHYDILHHSLIYGKIDRYRERKI
jgi:hypothetical protein